MRQPKISHQWLAMLVAAILIILVVPGVTQAKTSSGPQIYLQYASFDPLSGEPYVPSAQRMSITALDTATYLLQFSGPVREEWKAAVMQAGVRLYDYVPDYAFIAQMDVAAAAKVQGMSYVRWVGLYQPAYRVSPTLKETRLTTSSSEPVLLNVQTLPDVDLAGISDQVKVMGGVVVSTSIDATSSYLRVFVPAGQVDTLAAQEGVLWVEPYVEPVMSNDVGGASIMEASTIRASAGLYGSGQIVGVSDSGLDVGTTGVGMSDDFEGRIVEGQAMCATHYSNPLDMRTTWNDLHAHGTHVSGSVLGSGVLSGSNPGTHSYSGSYAGMAPEARIVFQALDSDGDGGLECIPVDLSSGLFGPAYALGARIHTNSWGGGSGDISNPYGVYTSQARQVDSAAWNYDDLLILYAAGNDGRDGDGDGKIDPDSIGSPATAKNALTIGASENQRPTINSTYGGMFRSFPVEPIWSDLLADNPGGMAGFSSRGPTDDGRIKPDLAAPGTFIISSFSHDPSARADIATHTWGATSNADYVYMGGTSMATPLTAGAATLVREWLTTVKGFTAPSAALMKAVIVNGALDISPGQYTSPQEIPVLRPNNVSGWGRVSLVGSIAPPAPLTVYLEDNTSGLTTGSSITYTLKVGGTNTSSAFESVGLLESGPVDLSLEETPVPESEVTTELPLTSSPLRLTLAWTDYPGSTSAAKALVNDLDLEVIAPNGTHYYGNGGTYTTGSPCLRNGVWDQCNNLEGVILPAAEYGSYTIVVHGANVPIAPQPFALVSTGDSLQTDVTSPADITNLSATTGSSSGAVNLTWTSPGDDDISGTASTYVLKYNTQAITSANWAASITVANVPPPSLALTHESLTVYGLKPGDTYYFAIKTQDEVPNTSEVSNSPSAQSSTAPDSVPPAAITDLSANPGIEIGEVLLNWTAPGDDEHTGTAAAYTLHMSSTQITSINWFSAALVTNLLYPSQAGITESFKVSNLTSGETYYFAIKTTDEVPNISSISNSSASIAEDRWSLFLLTGTWPGYGVRQP